MRCFIAIAVAVLAFAVGAARAENPLTTLQVGSLRIGGEARHYFVHVPEDLATRPAPTVVLLHGGGRRTDALGLRRRLNFDAMAAREGFVTVYPAGFGNRWNDGRGTPDIIAEGGRGADDVGFIDRMIEDLVASGLSDPAKIYLAGGSNGGMMAFRLACAIPRRFAAVAAVIANLPAGFGSICLAETPVPMLVMNGTADPLIPWGGGPVAARFGKDRGAVQSTEATLAHWRKVNGCGDASSRRTLENSAPQDGSTTTVFTWSDCSSGAPVLLYRSDGGGHRWPRRDGRDNPMIAALLGPLVRDFDAAAELWRFFQAHQR